MPNRYLYVHRPVQIRLRRWHDDPEALTKQRPPIRPSSIAVSSWLRHKKSPCIPYGLLLMYSMYVCIMAHTVPLLRIPAD